MRRREFILGIGSAGMWPCAARAQTPARVPRIGLLGLASPPTFASRLEAFRQGLRDFGYIEGTNVAIEYRWANGRYEQLPELAAELARSRVDLIVTHATPGSRAAKQATATIPIVIALIGDPVASGIVASIAQPGGNITGQSFFNAELRAKRIELLKELAPNLTQVAVILNADNRAVDSELRAMVTAARSLDIELRPYPLRAASDLVGAFENMEQSRIKAVETGDDPLSTSNVGAITALAARAKLLSIGPEDVVRAGGTMAYGIDVAATFRRAAYFVDRILKGANPADLPIERASRFQIALNLKAIKALGLTVPPTLLARADEVIE